MNPHVFLIHLTIMLLLPGVFAKTLPEANRAIDSEPEENERSDDSEALHEANRHGLKRNKDVHLKKHSRRGRSIDYKNQCAIMYKNEEPVGILQRFEDTYQLLPINSDEKIPVEISPLDQSNSEEVKQDSKRHADGTDAQDISAENPDARDEDLARFSDEKYPSIFAKFKIDSRVEKEGTQKTRNLEKRESKTASLFSEKHSNSLRSALSRIESNDETAAIDLKGILNDMGLIEDPQVGKREADLVEDEDLEHGTNKINLIKIDNNKQQRPKRGKSAKRSHQDKAVTKHYEPIEFPEPKSLDEDEYIDEYLNKHPEEVKQLQQHEREKRSKELSEQVERQIKERLKKIKEEVRSEIERIKANSNEEVEDDEAGERLDEDKEGKSQRRKRNVISNLMEEETSDLDPVLIGDNNPTPHIRKRREVAGHQAGLPIGKPEELETSNPPISKTSMLIIDLDPGSAGVPENKPTKEANVGTNQHFSLRSLKEYLADSEGNYEDTDGDDENDADLANAQLANREKKACKCAGKDCKCGSGKPLAAQDGNSFFSIDGTPSLTKYKFVKQPIRGGDMQSMQASENQRPLRDSEKDQEIASNLHRKLTDGEYVLDLDPEVYKITEEKSDGRQKRNNFLDLVALHGGGPVLDQLVSIRQRSMVPKIRPKRMAGDKEPLTLMNMSGEDLFGALPQGFDGELTRSKRVKRK